MFSLQGIAKRLMPPRAYQRLRARWWRVFRAAVVEYCPIMLPWFRHARATTPIARLRRLATRFAWDETPSLLETLCLCYATLVWPIRFLALTVEQLRRYGPSTREATHLSCWKQFRQMVYFAVRDNVPPASYYFHRLFEPANASRAGEYLQDDEMLVLYALLVRGLPSDRCLRDKQEFFELGRQLELPVAEVIGAFDQGRLKAWYCGAPGRLPARDLVLKPAIQAGGVGFERWLYDAAARRWRREGRLCSNEEFIQHGCELSVERRYIVQERLLNHADLLPLAANGLSTVRVITYRRPSGVAGPLAACLRMPVGESCIDNLLAGGIGAPVELATGTLGRAVADAVTGGTHDRHPTTEAAITGTRLPFWAETVEICLRAHASFAWTPFVGWDVALTPSGPVFVEANPDWSVESAQIPHNKPLGATEYPQIFLEHLEHRAQKLPR